jgi:CMP-N-acetylneuraminic acid synthetase
LRVIATVCARGGSVGVPNKNIRLLAGKPLIAHTVEQALACRDIEGVFVSTDSTAIADAARRAGATVPFMRPAELATSSAAKLPVVEHLVSGVERLVGPVDVVIDLDPTSPLREVRDIESCLRRLDARTDVVITGYEAEKNPYFNMVEERDDGTIGLVKPPAREITGRQSAPKVYAMNASIYVWRRSALGKGLWNGRTALYVMPRERSIDIDTELDFKLVELLMQEKR